MTVYDNLMRSLAAGSFANAYMLCGEEPYYIDKICDYFEHSVLDESARDFDLLVLYGRDLPSADIAPAVSAARGFSMMGGRMVIIVKEAQHIRKWDALALYMANPQPSSIIVLCYKYGKPDKRLSVFKNWEKQGGEWLLFEKIQESQIENWIREYITAKNRELAALDDAVRIDDRVTRILADSLGNDLTGIVSALTKLLDGRPPGVNVIDADLVERNIGISKDFNVFELKDALIRGDVVKANRITRYFADSKDHPMVKEMIPLFNFFANLLMYHYMPDKSDGAVVAQFGINRYFVREYVAASRRYSPAKTFAIIGYLRDTDARLKGLNNPSATESDLWKELIYKILH